ncbi:unnamed protein product [Haemonchus placei]|uniref:glucuronosyltransferase n=1 Tax=Haemonchus placei TaxID=6290 RepID=A0A158QPL3_HAEPC|nr:unnamed protein product [Haemonchus placei]
MIITVSSAIVEVGFYCRKAKELPNDYEKFVNDPTSKGTILVAFGSNIIWDYAPPDIMAAMLGAINRLSDYRVVFSYNGNMERVRFLGSHVKVIRWAPQKDVLSHKKTVVFVSHGGLKSSVTFCRDHFFIGPNSTRDDLSLTEEVLNLF